MRTPPPNNDSGGCGGWGLGGLYIGQHGTHKGKTCGLETHRPSPGSPSAVQTFLVPPPHRPTPPPPPQVSEACSVSPGDRVVGAVPFGWSGGGRSPGPRPGVGRRGRTSSNSMKPLEGKHAIFRTPQPQPDNQLYSVIGGHAVGRRKRGYGGGESLLKPNTA